MEGSWRMRLRYLQLPCLFGFTTADQSTVWLSLKRITSAPDYIQVSGPHTPNSRSSFNHPTAMALFRFADEAKEEAELSVVLWWILKIVNDSK
jgi:hypothetical protein